MKRAVITCVLACYIGYSVPFVFRNVYRDNSLRWKMTQTIDHPLLRGVYTTPERAEVVRGLLSELEQRVQPGDILLTYESIPMLNFITQTKPYLYNPWPILYLPLEFTRNLEKARRERLLPIAVLAKVEMRSSSWPKSGAVNQAETAKITRSLLHTFLAENSYKKVWENETFEILVSSQVKN